MPNRIKATISIATLIVGAGVYSFERQAGNDAVSWIVAGLAGFMVLAMWIFPEASVKNDDKS